MACSITTIARQAEANVDRSETSREDPGKKRIGKQVKTELAGSNHKATIKKSTKQSLKKEQKILLE
ncbi:MAG: hypothetical protein Q4C95_12355 [Planctomycetia bacterium]|nr:hypothetical protein [Planctomycetia bacterium]